MPIVDMQRRLREVGRIRIGEQRTNEQSGRKYPAKLSTFRFTSQDRQIIDAAADVFGGTAKRWEGAPAGEQWEVTSQASTIGVLVPPGGMAFSQWFEQWSGGGCQKRCDGRWDTIGDRACSCDPSERECKPHTRLSVILPELRGLGVWRLDTSGWYAAVELSGVVEVCEQAAARGQFFNARLSIEERVVKRTVDGKPETRRFGVPVLDVDVNFTQLLDRGADGEFAAARPALMPVPVNELPAAPQQSVAEQAAAVAQPKKRAPRKNAQVPIPPTTARPRTASQAATPASESKHCEGFDDLRTRLERLTPRTRAIYNGQRSGLNLPNIEWSSQWTPELVAAANALIDECLNELPGAS